MPAQQHELDVNAISEVVGKDLIDLLFQKAPTKVACKRSLEPTYRFVC
jgi:hypothetical protein